MDTTLGFALATVIPSLTTIVSLVISNQRLSDLRSGMVGQFNTQNALFDARLRRFEELLGARLVRIEGELKRR